MTVFVAMSGIAGVAPAQTDNSETSGGAMVSFDNYGWLDSDRRRPHAPRRRLRDRPRPDLIDGAVVALVALLGTALLAHHRSRSGVRFLYTNGMLARLLVTH